jgi:hypothetical protein
MTIPTTGLIQPAGRRPLGPARPLLQRAALGVALVLVAGAVLGVAWRLLAPVVTAQVIDGGVYLDGHSELEAAQDGWLAIVLGAAGLALATAQAVRSREPQLARALLALVAVTASGFVAWRVGVWLGPPSLGSQLAAHSTDVRTPLRLHTAAVLLVAPFMFAVTRSLAALFGSDRSAAG